MNIAQVGSIILRLPSKESRMDFLVNLLLPQDKTSLDSLLVISFSTSILSNRCASHGCCKDWKIDRLSPIIFHDLWHLWLAVCWTLWKLENWPKLLTQLDCHRSFLHSCFCCHYLSDLPFLCRIQIIWKVFLVCCSSLCRYAHGQSSYLSCIWLFHHLSLFAWM